MRTLRFAVVVAAAALVAACATPRVARETDPAPAAAALREALARRQAQLEAAGRWGFAGRVAVSDGQDAGSGRVDWEQDGAYYTVTLRLPVSGETWRLSGDGLLCQLDGGPAGPVSGIDPEELLARELGWQLPVDAMRRWVRGLAADVAVARGELAADGLPARLRENGWTIDFAAWDRGVEPPLPTRIVAHRAPHTVRLAIARWQPEHGR